MLFPPAFSFRPQTLLSTLAHGYLFYRCKHHAPIRFLPHLLSNIVVHKSHPLHSLSENHKKNQCLGILYFAVYFLLYNPHYFVLYSLFLYGTVADIVRHYVFQWLQIVLVFLPYCPLHFCFLHDFLSVSYKPLSAHHILSFPFHHHNPDMKRKLRAHLFSCYTTPVPLLIWALQLSVPSSLVRFVVNGL